MSMLTDADRLWKKIFADRCVTLTKEWVAGEIKKCRADVVYFINNYALIRCKLDDTTVLPVGSKIYDDVIDIKMYPIQEQFLRAVGANRNTVARKTRQSGVSMTTGLYILHRATFEKNKEFIVISRTQQHSIKFLDDLRFSQMHLPFFLRRKSTGNMKRMNLGSAYDCTVIRALPGGPDAARSYTATLLVLDEAAFIPAVDLIWASASPILTTTGGKAVVISTPWEDEGFFYDIVKAAESEQGSFKIVNIPWQSIPGRDQDWYDKECAQLLFMTERIRTELDMEFISRGNPFFDMPALHKKPLKKPVATIQGRLIELTDTHGPTGHLAEFYSAVSLPVDSVGYIYKFAEPGSTYMLSHDPAEDGTSSCQGIVVSRVDDFPVKAPEVVLEWRSKTPVLSTLVDLSMYYNGCRVLVEKNRGYAVIMHFTAAERTDSIITRPNGRPGIITNPDTRQILLKLLNKYFINDISEMPILMLEEAGEFRRTNSGKLKGKNYDDMLFALGIGLLGLATMPEQVLPGAVKTADQRLIMMQSLYDAIDEKQTSLSAASRYMKELQTQLFGQQSTTNRPEAKMAADAYSHLLPR